MRKYILFLLLACLHLAARGQTIEDVDLSWLPQRTQAAGLQYWFDDDKGSLSTSQQVSGTHLLDVSSLLTGLHTIHYQIIDNTGKVAVPYSALFLKTAQYELETASGLQYWIDDDAQSLKKTSLQNGVSTIDVSSALEGLHTLHFQILDSHDMPSAISSAIFMKMGKSMGEGSLHAERLIYWYDEEEQVYEAELDGGVKMLDASHLMEGLHTLHYQVLCNNGALTTSRSAFFFRMSYDVNDTKAHALRYWYDDQTSVLTAPIGGGTQMLDVAGLTAGLHVLHVQIEDEAGDLGVPVSTMFFKMDKMAELAAAQSQRYWFDDDESQVRECAVTNGVQQLDVKGLSTGFHTLHYQLVDDAGNVTVPYSGFFMKMAERDLADGKNAITRYQYWQNEDSELTTVDLSKPTNPFQLISLIPMESKPIRSSCFHFEAKEGEPMIYAKNDIHFRFYDAFETFGDESAQFIDYKVSQKVTDITPLQTVQTFARPEENGIKWFSFESAPGDTIAFYCNQATTLQVYSPSGKELYAVSGYQSVSYGGIHTWEEGTHYLAVHDVTGSRSSVTINFMHMDKYDVVDQDVRVVGNGGCSTITFQGNGFNDLYEVVLFNAQGDSIHSLDVGHESDASTSATFDFTDVELGKYSALFHFTEEDKTFAEIVTVEEPVDIELALKVSYPSRFRRGTATTYTVEITNKGNMTAYMVPLYTYIRNESKTGISRIDYELLNNNKGIGIAGLSDLQNKELYELMSALNDDVYFTKIYTKETESNDSSMIRTNYSFVDIPPYSSQSFKLVIESLETVEAWFTTSKDWRPFSNGNSNNNKQSSLRKSISLEDYYCCYKEHIECFIEQVTATLDIASLALTVSSVLTVADPEVALFLEFGALEAGLTSCAASLANDQFKRFGATLCSSDKTGWEKFWDSIKSSQEPSAIQFTSMISCFGTLLSGWGFSAKAIKKASGSLIDEIGSQLGAMATGLDFVYPDTSCEKTQKKKPNCPPNPDNDGGDSQAVNSCEPNDIRGYLSESGSSFMRDDVEEVTYIIDSENDPVFADAPAHLVIITDTIQSAFYDLESLSTRNITIGDVSMDLDGTEQNFVKTMDLRPRINVIAQVEQKYDPKTGIAQWIWTSLDPMTLEPTDDVMQGVLPVNDESHIGEGHITYRLRQKVGLPDGTVLTNQADIIFDTNEPVFTPVWTNIIDAVAPKGSVIEVTQHGDSATIVCDGTDERSGIWKYEVYTQPGVNAPWLKVGECFADSAMISYEVFEGLDYGFCALAVDSAGNVEQKELVRELSLNPVSILGDVNGDNEITFDDVTGIANLLLQINTTGLNASAADINQDGVISIKDVVMLIKIIEDAQVQNVQSRQSELIIHPAN